MRAGKALVLLGASAIIGALPYMRANAFVYCCDPWGIPGATAFIQAGSGVVSTLTSQVTSVSQYISNSLQQTWATGFAKSLEHLSKQTAANRTFEHGRIAAMSDLYLNNVRATAAENAIEPALLDETVTNAVLMSEHIVQSSRLRRREDAALAADLRSADIAPSDPVSRHAPYCGPRGLAAGLCSHLPSSSMQGADLLVTTITNPGGGQYETMTDQEVEAGRAFVRNIVAPLPLRSMPTHSAQASQYEALLLADQAVLSLAGHSLNSVMHHRVRRREGQ